MNNNFALGYVLGQSLTNSDTPILPDIDADWERPSDWPPPPNLPAEGKFVYLLGSSMQFAELDFTSVDCDGIRVEWGDGSTDTSQLIDELKGTYAFVQNNNGILYHAYSSFYIHGWIKIYFPDSTKATVSCVGIRVDEAIRNCSNLTSIKSTSNTVKLIGSDICYCESDTSYVRYVSAISSQIIFTGNPIILNSLSIQINPTAAYCIIKGSIPAKALSFAGVSSYIRRIVIEDAYNITSLANILISSSAVLCKSVIILNAVNLMTIGTIAGGTLQALQKVQILRGDQELSEKGIIIDCPKLSSIGNIVNNTCMADVSVKITSDSELTVNMQNINYSFKEIIINTVKIAKPMYISLQSSVDSTAIYNIEKIKVNIKNPPSNGIFWGNCFFISNSIDTIFDTANEFYPKLILNSLFTIYSVSRFLRALSRGFIKFSDNTKYQITVMLGIPANENCSTFTEGNSLSDVNRLISSLPYTDSGRITVLYYSNGKKIEQFTKAINSSVNYNSAAAKGWTVFPEKI